MSFQFGLLVKVSSINLGFSILSVGKDLFDKFGFVFFILIVGKGKFVLNLIVYKEKFIVRLCILNHI